MRHVKSVLMIVACLVVAAKAADKLGDDLIKAAKKGDVAKAQALVRQGVPVDSQDKDGKTALWEATRHEKADVVAMLIEAKADLNLPSKEGETPLFVAAGRGNPKVLTMLMAAGADTSLRSPAGTTLLMAVAGGGHTDVVGTLIKSGARVNEEDNGGETALHYAATQGRGQTIRALVDAHAEVDHRSHDGMTPLMEAAERGHDDAVTALLWNKARPNLANPHDKEWTALLYAAKSGTSTVIDTLLSQGADVHVVDTTDDEAIHVAARAGNTAIVGALLDKGSYVNQRGADRMSPLEISVERDDLGTAEMLLTHNACVTRNAVETATKKKSEKMVKLLQDHSGNDCRTP